MGFSRKSLVQLCIICPAKPLVSSKDLMKTFDETQCMSFQDLARNFSLKCRDTGNLHLQQETGKEWEMSPRHTDRESPYGRGSRRESRGQYSPEGEYTAYPRREGEEELALALIGATAGAPVGSANPTRPRPIRRTTGNMSVALTKSSGKISQTNMNRRMDHIPA